MNTTIRPAALGLLGSIALAANAGADDASFFESTVVPLLETNCYKCHSHKSGKMKGGLTLDSRSGWAEGGDSGPAIVPGKPEESLLIEAVRHGDPDFKMPPKKKLSGKDIATLEEWVRRGAPDPRVTKPERDLAKLVKDWWSLKPLARPPIPETGSPGGNPIDAFIDTRLREGKLSRSPAADRRTLIRRLLFDLHGLPPTPEEVAHFVADPDPQAYEKLVDRLLASPRYGERWARHWLDTIHFADSHGCEHDIKRPNAWRFRDYVIARLNEDVRWSNFIREQLAPDVFYPERSDLVAGLGFIGAGPLELSRAGTAPVTFDYLDRDDIVTQTMAAFASSTVNCARCHDHKFDPVTQEDYYSLQAVFAGVGKGDVEFDDDPAVGEKRRELHALREIAKRGETAEALAAEHAAIVAKWIEANERELPSWEALDAQVFLSAGGAGMKRLDDNSILLSGTRPETDTYTITSTPKLKTLTALRLEVLADESLPMKGPGRCDNGNLHLTEFEAQLFESGSSAAIKLKIKRASADFDQAGWTIAHALDGDLKTAWGIHPKVGESHHAVFELEQPVEVKPDSRLVILLKQLHGGGHLIGRFRLSTTSAPGGAVQIVPAAVREALKVKREERSAGQSAAIASHALGIHADEELAKLPPRPVVYAASPSWSHAKKLNAPAAPKLVHVLKRGEIDKPGKVAAPGALSALTALAGEFALPHPGREATRRAALASWLSAPENPLTWRSIVNRVWHYHFGRGLCDTPNDLGRMGGTPSHPELIDWLATWFRDDAKGSLKALHRLILTSETYRQRSGRNDDDAALAIDFDNRLLWRMNRPRLDAESFRDAVLQMTGRIDLTMGGPGVEQFTTSKGRQDTPNLDYEAYDWSSAGAARRSIYRVVWRGIADPFMEALDFPDMALLAPKRGASVSALQALTLFNNDFVLHHSEALAARLQDEHPSVAAQARRAFELTFLRDPTPNEQDQITAHANTFGLPNLCRVLLNSNEFLFID